MDRPADCRRQPRRRSERERVLRTLEEEKEK